MVADVPDVAIGPVEALWRYRRRTLPCVVTVAFVAALASLWSGGEAVAVTAVHLTDPRGVPMFRDGTTASTDLEAYAAQRAEFATSDIVVRATAEGIGAPVDLVRTIARAAPTAGSRIAIRCHHHDATLALSVCTALADAYIEQSRSDTSRRAEVALASLRTTRQTLIDERLARQPDAAPTSGAIEQIEVQIAQTALKAALFDAGVEFIDAPLLIGSSPLIDAARAGVAAMALGTLAAAGIAWGTAVRRPMIDDPELVSAHLGAPVLGRLPELGSSIDTAADDLAAIRPTGVLVVTSGARREQRGTPRGSPNGADHDARSTETPSSDLIIAVAEAWAREGRTVLVVDGRPDRPRLSQHLGSPTMGLTDVLAGVASIDETIVRLGRTTFATATTPRIHVIGSGHPVDHMTSLLRTPRARDVLGHLKNTYELILVDSPPLLDSGEGAVLAGLADGVVVVLPDRTARQRLIALRQRLDVLHAPLVGVIIDPNPHLASHHRHIAGPPDRRLASR